MFLRKLYKSMLQPLNLAIGALTIFLTYFIGSPLILFLGLLVFLFFVVQKLRSEDFSQLLETEGKVHSIRKLDMECERLAEVPKNSTNSEKRYRVREVLKNKNDIIALLYKDKDNSLKQRIASQAVELVMVYIRLIENYYSRLRDVDDYKVKELEDRIQKSTERLEDRIQKSTERLEGLTDEAAKDDLQNAVDLDNRLLSKLKEEKDELVALSSKIGYIESSINLFKQQMVSSIEQDEILDGVQDVVNEAIALDNVLTDRKKQKGRI